ncbi:hypothetical protein [Streptomyces harbinensis]|uniref:Uncharacterized protein n=1 Tax=Streptomyces harbinensis TaxID=1176198 RepID=A0A1I6WCW9_9ACTN|nr:hypothetical protein [Streptomyces harbinensis]SFT23591.1 hypothetical protein SAMN05444716_1199 [Streptomyces harbinensis]
MPTPRTARLIGGPLDGHELDVSTWTEEEIRTGVYHVVEGWEERADYEPDAGDPLAWKYQGPVPG